jgi:hypothetical protein
MKVVIWKPALFAGLLLWLCVACGDESNPTEAEDNLCAGESGFGARVMGRASRVDVCVPDDNVVDNVEKGVVTFFTVENRYNVTAETTARDGTIYQIQMNFPHKPNFPAALNLTGNQAQAKNDPDGVWFYYREIPSEGDAVESVAITGGSFTLSFSDTDVAAGTFQGVGLEIQIQGTHDPAGSRSIPEGFFSISTDS